MFAGIVSAVGRVAASAAQGDGVRLRIEAPGFGLDDVKIGDSIALAGVCHTVVAKSADSFEVDTSRATLDVTSGLEQGRAINLEKSLRMGDRIDGHLVSGHVDGVGKVTAFEELGGSARLEIEAPAEYMSGILGELNSKHAEIREVTAEGTSRRVAGTVPLFHMFGYATTLRSLSRPTRPR